MQLDAAGLDAVDCKLAAGSLTKPVSGNPCRFVERSLELLPLPARECLFATVTNFPVGLSPISVVAGDFNGDMKPDVEVANNVGNKPSVLLNQF